MALNYLSKQHLNGFDHYEYSSIDTSPLSNYVMHPFWNQVVKIVPKNIAPNVLTFSGFMLTTINTLLMTIYDYSFCGSSDLYPNVAPVPNWIWLVCAINHFLAHTLDGIDGKQARRTNSSGPLGELMDHGLDSWACLLMPCCFYSVFGISAGGGDPLRVFMSLWVVHFCFFLSHWEKYITGVLYLPWGYDVSQIVLLVAFLITSSNSYTFWKVTVPVINMDAADAVELLIYSLCFLITVPVSLYNIYFAYRHKHVKTETLSKALKPGVPLLAFFLMTLFWVLYSPNNVLYQDPRIFYYMVGTVFSNIACRLIISQMSSTESETVNWMIYPVGIAMAIAFGVPSLGYREVYVLRILTLFVTLAHIHYGVVVVRQLCEHFGINCFSLRKRSSD